MLVTLHIRRFAPGYDSAAEHYTDSCCSRREIQPLIVRFERLYENRGLIAPGQGESMLSNLGSGGAKRTSLHGQWSSRMAFILAVTGSAVSASGWAR